MRTALHLFAGSGGCTLGFKLAGFDSLGSLDFDEKACRDLERLTGGPAFCRDIAAMEPGELFDLTGGRCPDVVVMSPPCLPADGLVLTSQGPRRIDSIRAGDRVLSHKGRYCNVAKTNTRFYQGTMHGLQLNGTVDHDIQWYTDEHPLWVRRVVRGTDKVRTLRDPTWTPAGKVRVGDRVGFPVISETPGTAAGIVASVGDPRIGKTRTLGRVRDLSEHATSPALWALIGAYLGDGDRRATRNYTIRWSVGARNGDAYNLVTGALLAIGLRFHVEAKSDRNVRICTDSRHLWLLCGLFGSSSIEKTIPEAIMGLEGHLAEAMINGLRTTDGHEHGDGVWSIASISLPLLRGVQRLMLRFKAYGGIHRALRAGRGIIEGREVNISDSYRIVFRDRPKKTCYKFEDGAVWLRVKRAVERRASEPVWNLEVDDDDTYCSPLIATHNCKSFSGCMPAAKAASKRYVDMSQLAVRGVFLAIEAWAPLKPKMILLENVPRIQTRGRELLDQVVSLLQRSGYATHGGTHNCGEIGGLAQSRERFLLVARDMERCPGFLIKPPPQRMKAIGEVLGPLPSPASDHGDEMHRLPLLSPMNWLRLAAIRAGKDWRDLPERIVIGGDPSDRHQGKLGVESWDEPAHTVIGRGSRPGSTWASAADPRVGWDPARHKGRPDSWGVGQWSAPSLTVRGRQEVQSSRASVADPRLGDRAARQNGGFGVEDGSAPSHAILGEGTVRNTRCSVADPRLAHKPRRGSFGVLDGAEPAPTVRGRHDVRQAPAAVVDERGWPVPTHHLVREGDDLVLYGPPIDLATKRPALLVIRAPDGTWHRPLTDRELATLQSFPTDCYLEGPSSSSKTQPGRREHIGNAIPVKAAQAIGEAAMKMLEAADAGFQLVGGGDIWVREGAEA